MDSLTQGERRHRRAMIEGAVLLLAALVLLLAAWAILVYAAWLLWGLL